ncbi:hypothetical protein [Bacillus sp. T33-2]|uniref:hypothetical protein n=1 Tax=Bacillus sp. T33-2 TaxID=2054168 RepID=UPI000C76D117|nr:hypothetical protein [Bacillus sp. T33-2]PLR93203.1 hypothetical protein CVD19_19560 [Bacillus sp. T33-2]
MKLVDHLTREQKQKLNQLKAAGNKTPSAWKNEHGLTRKDWEEIMGLNRDTYVRRYGAVRRR